MVTLFISKLLRSSGRLLIMIIVALLLVEKVHCFGISSSIQSIKPKSQAKQMRQATCLQAQLHVFADVKRGGAVSLVAGKLFAGFRKLAVDGPTAKAIWKELAKESHCGDAILIAALAWGTIPLTKLIHRAICGQDSSNDFLKSSWSKSADFVSEGAKVAGLVFCVDFLTIVLHGLKFRFASTYPWSHWAAKILYTLWAALRVAKIKRFFVYQAVRKNSQRGQAMRSKAALYDKLMNLVITLTTLLLLLDFLSVETGHALTSFFALGGISTLVISLACKDLATQFLGTLAVTATDKFREGENILLGDGTGGAVEKVGWMDTSIRRKFCFDC
jgi:small-conductance mechanosensitive channel